MAYFDITGMELYTKYKQYSKCIFPIPTRFNELSQEIMNIYQLRINGFEIRYEDDVKGNTVINNDNTYYEAWYQCKGQGIYLIINEKPSIPFFPPPPPPRFPFQRPTPIGPDIINVKCLRGAHKVIPNKLWMCNGCARLNEYALKTCPLCMKIRNPINSACPYCRRIYKV